MRIRISEAIQDIPAADWNALLADSNPFLRHEFLAALENSGCVSDATGWLPCHLLYEDESGSLIGALPLYQKMNSHGMLSYNVLNTPMNYAGKC